MIIICRLWGISYGEFDERMTPGQMARVMFPELEPGGPHAFGFLQQLPDGSVSRRRYPGRVTKNMSKLNNIRTDCQWLAGPVAGACP